MDGLVALGFVFDEFDLCLFGVGGGENCGAHLESRMVARRIPPVGSGNRKEIAALCVMVFCWPPDPAFRGQKNHAAVVSTPCGI
jgi:hypothetical protein